MDVQAILLPKVCSAVIPVKTASTMLRYGVPASIPMALWGSAFQVVYARTGRVAAIAIPHFFVKADWFASTIFATCIAIAVWARLTVQQATLVPLCPVGTLCPTVFAEIYRLCLNL